MSDKDQQPKYGEDWKTIPMLYKPVTDEVPHCPFCLEQVDSWQGDYSDPCLCGRWLDGRYKKSQTKAEKEIMEKATKAKNKAIQEKRELAIYKKVKARLKGGE